MAVTSTTWLMLGTTVSNATARDPPDESASATNDIAAPHDVTAPPKNEMGSQAQGKSASATNAIAAPHDVAAPPKNKEERKSLDESAAPNDVTAATALPFEYWSSGALRAFAAARGIVGTGYGRLNAAVGYGRPFWQWIGLDSSATLTLDAVSAQAGLRGSYMVVEGMFTLRRTDSFAHRTIDDTARATDDMLERHGAGGARYLAVDAGVWGCIPYGRWLGAWELDWVRPLSLRDGQLVLEEIQRVVIGAGGLWSVKLGIHAALSSAKRAYVGAMVESLALVGREPGAVYRVGPSFWVAVSEHTELGGYLTWPFYGPDSLGFLTGMYGAIGLQYQLATGEPHLRFP